MATVVAAVVATNVEAVVQRVGEPLPAVLLDKLDDAQHVEVRTATGQAVRIGTLATESEDATGIDRAAPLAGAGERPSATGLAEVELTKENGVYTKQELEAGVEGLGASIAYTVFIDDAEVWTFTTNQSGKAALKLSTNIRE